MLKFGRRRHFGRRRGWPAKIRPERTILHPNTVGSGSVQPMLSINEAQRAKQTRIRTILAEFLAAVEKNRVSVLGFLGTVVPAHGQPQSG